MSSCLTPKTTSSAWPERSLTHSPFKPVIELLPAPSVGVPLSEQLAVSASHSDAVEAEVVVVTECGSPTGSMATCRRHFSLDARRVCIADR